MSKTDPEETSLRDRFAGWLALLARVGVTLTATLMAYALLIAERMTPWLTWSIIGFQTIAVVTIFLGLIVDRRPHR
jgi:hypothetical protein